MKKNCKNQIKKNLEQKKYLKEKVVNCMSNGKGMIIVSIVELMKKTLNEIFKCNLLKETFKMKFFK